MLVRLLMALAFATSSASMAMEPKFEPQEVAVERFGVYVVSEDLERSSIFYGKLFGKQPQVKNAGMVAFDVAGGLYAAVSREKYAPQSKRGDTTAPYIKVKDIYGLFQRVKNFAPESLRSKAVVEEGPFKFFKLLDPDGNLIEFFAVVVPEQ